MHIFRKGGEGGDVSTGRGRNVAGGQQREGEIGEGSVHGNRDGGGAIDVMGWYGGLKDRSLGR